LHTFCKNRIGLSAAASPDGGVEAADVRQREVHQHQIRQQLDRHFDRLPARSRLAYDFDASGFDQTA
jgi:hypothetical protein